MKSHTLAPIKGSEGTDCGSETVGSPRNDVTRVGDSCHEDSSLVGPFPCGGWFALLLAQRTLAYLPWLLAAAGGSGAGRLAAGVVRPSELEDSAFLFPVVGCDTFLGTMVARSWSR